MGKFLAILPIVFLSGCAIPVAVSLGVSAASVAVNETTGKTTTDHVVSAVNRKDCRVSRAGKEDICQDETIQPKIQITTTNIKPSTTQEIESKYR